MREWTIPTDRMRIGMEQDEQVKTGCTVFLFPQGARAVYDLRGGAPGTHELGVLQRGNLVNQIHGLVFTGGSAFGLECISGVVRFLHEKNIGYDTGVAKVPIVPGAVIYDLARGAFGFPDREMGFRAAAGAGNEVRSGRIGAGTGATVGKVAGMEFASEGGFGIGWRMLPEGWIAAFAVVNALGDVVHPEKGTIVGGARDSKGNWLDSLSLISARKSLNALAGENTTLVAVVTNLRLTVDQLKRIAIMSHDGMARCIRPCHTIYDGDIVFAISLDEKEPSADVTSYGVLAAQAVEEAIISAVEPEK